MMTRTHWIICLMAILSHAIFADQQHRCPLDHPYAFYKGKFCCANDKEKQLGKKGCDGSVISDTSTCCKGDNFTCCSKPPCQSSVPAICKTSECQAMSKRVTDFMDPKADPCKDFYQYACGKFLNEEMIPDGDDILNPFWDSFGDNIEERGKLLLETRPKNKSAFISDEIARDYYDQCMDESAIEEAGLTPVKKLLEDIGGWPVTKGSWIAEGNQWYERDFKMASSGVDPVYVINLHVFYYFKTNKERIIYLDQPNLGLKGRYLIQGFNNSKVQHYYKYMVESAKLMGAKHDRALKEMEEAVKFEIAIAKIYDKGYYNAYKMLNPRTVKQVEKHWIYPTSFMDYINNIFKSSGVPQIQVNEKEKVLVLFPKFIEEMFKLLNATPSYVVANYQAWRLFKHVVPNLNKEARKLEKEYTYKISNVNITVPRWKKCVKEMGYNLRVNHANWHKFKGLIPAAASLYLRHYFPPEEKKSAQNMIDEIKKAYGTMLRNVKWMEDGVKKESLRKLSNMTELIGGPIEFYDPNVLNKLYKNLKIDKNYFLNARRVEKSWKTFDLEMLRIPVEPDSWFEHPYILLPNAFAVPFTNSVEFPAGIIQKGFFDTAAPEYINYARFGAMYGHEGTHHYDHVMRHFDSERNLRNWWDTTTFSNFVKIARCFVKQYGSFHSSQVGMNVNGGSTFRENLADNGGIKIAYYAYERHVKEHGPDKLLPGLNFTQEQMFFLSHAQMRCAKVTDDVMKETLTSLYPPFEFRIKGALINFDKFSNAFGCKLGSEWNPKHKCQSW